jgi:hypothetical protein
MLALDGLNTAALQLKSAGRPYFKNKQEKMFLLNRRTPILAKFLKRI